MSIDTIGPTKCWSNPIISDQFFFNSLFTSKLDLTSKMEVEFIKNKDPLGSLKEGIGHLKCSKMDLTSLYKVFELLLMESTSLKWI